jgi:signal transduction histidine kinase
MQEIYHNETPLFTPIFDRIFAEIPCAQSSIYFLDGSDLRYVASRGKLPPEQILKLNFPLEGSGGALVAMRDEHPVLIADVKGSDELAVIFQESAMMAPEGTYDFIGSWIGFPIHVGGKVISLLDICGSERNQFTESQVERLNNIIRQLEPAIENAILLTNLAQRSSELETINAIQQAIYRHLDLNYVLQLIAEQAHNLTAASQIVIFTSTGSDLIAAASAGQVQNGIIPGTKIAKSNSLVNAVLVQGQVLRVLNIDRDERINPQDALRYGIKSMLALPLNTNTQSSGLLLATGNSYGAFSPNDERLLTTLAGGAVTAIDNAFLYQQERERRLVSEKLQLILAKLSSAQIDQATFSTVLNIGLDLLRADAVAVAQKDALSGKLTVSSQANFPVDLIGDLEILVNCFARQDFMTYGNEGRPYLMPILFSEMRKNRKDAAKSTDQAEVSAVCTQLESIYTAVLHIDLTANDQVIGALEFFWITDPHQTKEESATAETLSRYLSLTIDRLELAQKAKELVRLQERQRIAQNLHDTVTQLLFRSGLEARWLLDNSSPDNETRLRLQTIQHLNTRSTYELRSAIFALNNAQLVRSHSLLDLLQAQVDEFQNEYGINASLIVLNDPASVPFEITEAVYRLVREALTNVYKHARATAAFVSINRIDNTLYLTIQDNGTGIQNELTANFPKSDLHFGMRSMKYLTEPFNGQLTISNDDDHGVIVKAVFPLA